MAIIKKKTKTTKESTTKKTTKKEKVVKEKVVEPEVKVENVKEVKETPIVEVKKEIEKQKVQGLSDFLF